MQKRRQIISFLILNVLVSALTMWIVLNVWFDSSANSSNETAADSISVGGPSDAAAAISGVSQGAGQLEISRIVGAGDLDSERVEIHHVGESEISLSGWLLRDEDGNEYLFPNLTMVGQGAVTLFTRSGFNTVVELYWGSEQTVWETGETATLVDPEGNAQATYIVP